MNTKRIISLVASLALVLSLSVGLTDCGDKAAQDDNQDRTDLSAPTAKARSPPSASASSCSTRHSTLPPRASSTR